MTVIAIGLAAGLGAVCRYLLDRLVQHQHRRTFPWGTVVVNVTGSFLLGLLTGLAAHHGLPHPATDVVGIGFLGGYTTWSAYVWESLALAEAGAVTRAGLNVVGSLLAGCLAAAAGLGLALV